MLKYTLPKSKKLLKTDDFSSVFNFRKRLSGRFLALHYKPAENVTRLGLVIAKKVTKLSVKRNYMRRVLRELFRLNQQTLPKTDILLRAQKTFEPRDFVRVQAECLSLFKQLAEKHDKQGRI